MLYFKETIQNKRYEEFIEYALTHSDYFMLVYCNYAKPAKKNKKKIKEGLKPLLVKTRTNPAWPGTISLNAMNYKYKIRFYKSHESAKQYLLLAKDILGWQYPEFPEDLCFFRGNQCWICTIAHEDISFMLHPTNEDVNFLNRTGITYEENSLEDSEWEFIEDGLK